MLMTLFLLVSALTGYFLLKRRGASSHNLVGLLKFVAVSSVLFVVATFRVSLVFLTKVPLAKTLVPDWYAFGIVHCAGGLLFSSALLYFVFTAIYAKHMSLQMANEGLELSSVTISTSLLDPKVPKAYEI